MKKYSGQAIAIIMVVLVVAAVIGASLYSRMTRNKGEVVDTRESQKALEQAGNVLDAFTTSDLLSLQKLLSKELNEDDDGKIVLSDIGAIGAFVALGVYTPMFQLSEVMGMAIDIVTLIV